MRGGWVACNLEASMFCFRFRGVLFFASFYCLWNQIKKVPVMCETSSRVLFFLSIS